MLGNHLQKVTKRYIFLPKKWTFCQQSQVFQHLPAAFHRSHRSSTRSAARSRRCFGGRRRGASCGRTRRSRPRRRRRRSRRGGGRCCPSPDFGHRKDEIPWNLWGYVWICYIYRERESSSICYIYIEFFDMLYIYIIYSSSRDILVHDNGDWRCWLYIVVMLGETNSLKVNELYMNQFEWIWIQWRFSGDIGYIILDSTWIWRWT